MTQQHVICESVSQSVSQGLYGQSVSQSVNQVSQKLYGHWGQLAHVTELLLFISEQKNTEQQQRQTKSSSDKCWEMCSSGIVEACMPVFFLLVHACTPVCFSLVHACMLVFFLLCLSTFFSPCACLHASIHESFCQKQKRVTCNVTMSLMGSCPVCCSSCLWTSSATAH